MQFIITSHSLSYVTSFFICRYLCRYCNVEVWTLVILSTSSIWGCPFCRTKGQGRRLGKRLVILIGACSWYVFPFFFFLFILLAAMSSFYDCIILFSRWWLSWEQEQSSRLWFNGRRKYWEYAFSWNGVERACFLEGSLLINCLECFFFIFFFIICLNSPIKAPHLVSISLLE